MEDGKAKRAALAIAKRKRPVFPCNAHKEPLTRRGFYDATTNPADINEYWTNHSGAFIGIPTGERSGVFILDIDHLPAIAQLPGALPRTRTVKTFKAGRHFYFKHVPGVRCSAGDIAEGVDVRGEGGYIIAPPSSGYTVVDNSPISDAPEWLLELIREKPKPERKTSPRPVGGRRADDLGLGHGDPIPNGARNNTLAQVAGRLHDGRDLADLERALLEVNETWCTPPLPADEVRRIARSIYRKDPCTPGGGGGDSIPEIAKPLALFEQAMICHDWGRWPGGLSITKALLRKAREFGRLRPDGNIELNLSYNELALEASTSERSIKRYAKKIKLTGLVGQDNADRKQKEAGTWVLNVPAPRVTTRLTRRVREYIGSCGDTSRTFPLTRPRLRYSERYISRLGKSWEKCRDALEASPDGYLNFEDLAELARIKRVRELRNPRPNGWLHRAIKAGLVRVTSGGLKLLAGWEQAEDDMRQRTGEIAAATRDREAYKRKRKDWLDRINTGEIVKCPMSDVERNARSDLEVLREAGAERARYRRAMKAFKEKRNAEKRRNSWSYRTFHAWKVMSNPDSAPGVLTEAYWRGEIADISGIAHAVAKHFKDGDNWRAWREHVREAYRDWRSLEGPRAKLRRVS